MPRSSRSQPRAETGVTTAPRAHPYLDVTEKMFTAQIRQLAATLGYALCYHTFNAYRSPKGFPDLCMVNVQQRRVVYAELKSEKGKPTPAQTEWLEALRECGQEAYLWRPSDFDEAAAILRPGGGKKIDAAPVAGAPRWI